MPFVHSRAAATHSHVHAHQHEAAASITAIFFRHDPGVAPAVRSALKSFGVGLVHGLAASAAIALVVLGAIPQPRWGVVYLAVSSLGTIAAMVVITRVIGVELT
jgi:hypothetical protein